jgi:hypothetical protein
MRGFVDAWGGLHEMPRLCRYPGAPIAWFLVVCVVAPAAMAQYEVEGESPVWLRALVDVRAARGGPAPSWTDTGAGRLRFGGDRTLTTSGTQFERQTEVRLAQLAIEIGATLPGEIRAQAQINFEPDIADAVKPWLIEATLRRDWGTDASGWGLQAGVMNLPFSLEHVGPAWTPDYGLSASALNSWLWEDASLAGLEAEVWRETSFGLRVSALAGTGFGPDRMARLLALRGWAIGDQMSGINTDLPLPNRTERQDIYDELDDRPALYTWVTFSDRSERASLKLGYFDNRGDQTVPGVWHTRFAVGGIELHPHESITVLGQYLEGSGRVAAPNNDSALVAWYGLVSWQRNRHRVSARYDSFHIRDLDGGPNTRDDGDGVTVSWQYQWKLRHRLAFEHTWLNARRPASGIANPTPDGWQISYRYRY